MNYFVDDSEKAVLTHLFEHGGSAYLRTLRSLVPPDDFARTIDDLMKHKLTKWVEWPSTVKGPDRGKTLAPACQITDGKVALGL